MDKEKVYCGKRKSKTAGAGSVWRNGKLFPHERSLKVRNHSPDGFQWGYGGSGPAQLALALLLDVLHSTRLANQWYQDFKWQVVGKLPDQWVLTETEIMRWFRDVKPTPDHGQWSEDETEKENRSGLAEGTSTASGGPNARDGIPVLEKDDPRGE